MSAIQTITKQKTQTAVTIKSVKIEKLFEIFDYDIEFADGENVLIITGPNGFGKTTILNILYSLFESEWGHDYDEDYPGYPHPFEDFLDPPFYFLEKLIFDKISISLSDNTTILVKKVLGKHSLSFTFYDTNGKLIDSPPTIKNGNYDFSDKEKDIANCINIYLIKEQRSQIKTITHNFHTDNDPEYIEKAEDTIEFHSKKLREISADFLKQYHNKSQSLDNSYPTRLISEKRKITKEEYDKRFTSLREKQNKLIKYGLYEKQATLEYSEEDAKALLVYLNDLEKKLYVFDELLAKLDLFTEILNKRRFTFKIIKVNSEKGFYFETSKGKNLKMNELSSGERHQVILLYELIFNTTPNTLVLIDEPEISLHITWQKEFVRDLHRIIELQNFQAMIATHAPAIVNDRWDLVYNLGKAV